MSEHSAKLSHPITLYTIGFTHKSAQDFFLRLQQAGVQKVVDIRLNNVSQLAGFSKKNDLAYFLRAIANIGYLHVLDLAPTQDLFDAYKKQKGAWADYETAFKCLIAERQIETILLPEMIDQACLLCSEPTPEHCHRRLVAEYLRSKWQDVAIVHL